LYCLPYFIYLFFLYLPWIHLDACILFEFI
jgi:hypothetical protein